MDKLEETSLVERLRATTKALDGYSITTKGTLREHYDACRAICDALEASMEREAPWYSVEIAPINEAVEVRAGHMTFEAILRPEVSMKEDGADCDQWQASREGEHPPCWSGGACWASNEDEVMSLQPKAWRRLSLSQTQEGRS